jgi:hypothetical protein
MIPKNVAMKSWKSHPHRRQISTWLYAVLLFLVGMIVLNIYVIYQ